MLLSELYVKSVYLNLFGWRGAQAIKFRETLMYSEHRKYLDYLKNTMNRIRHIVFSGLFSVVHEYKEILKGMSRPI
jgi:hypothetical protein